MMWRRFRPKGYTMCALALLGLPAFAQSSFGVPNGQEGPAVLSTAEGQKLAGLQPQSPYSGGVATEKATPGVMTLSLDDAVSRGLKQNLGALLSSDVLATARGKRWKALSALLPHLSTATSFNAHQTDLKATIGRQIPSVPPIIGPFGVFDARAYLKQSIFDWQSIERERSAGEQIKSAEYSYKNARELVVLAVSASYLLAIADHARVDSAEAQRDTAQALFQQTSDQKKAGVAAAIDVLRSQVELQAREQELIVAKNSLAKQKLAFARTIGLPGGQQFRLTTSVAYQPLASMTLDEALSRAYASRPDFQSAMAQVRAAELGRKAVSAERYPSLSVQADYGDIGVNPANSHGTVNAAAVLKIPIFQGGRIHGEALEASAVLAEARQRLENLRGQVDQDVRDAFLDLKSTADRVAVAKISLDLATQTLQQARDRFASGVTDNIEVVQAQESLASANESYISSLYSYNLAKITLARSMGIAESSFKDYLKGN